MPFFTLLTYPILAFALLAFGSAPSGVWDQFNYAPSSKTVYPKSIYRTEGNVQSADELVNNTGAATLSGEGSWVALDFGVEVGGLISMNFDSPPSAASFSLSFTESPVFVRPDASDDSSFPSANQTYDGVLTIPAPLPDGYWTQPAYALRGGFRYLTVVSNTDDALEISNVSCAISFMPHVENLRDYSGYFYALDSEFEDQNFLMKLWYAGAYTIQTNIVPLNTGRQVPFMPAGTWANNATLGVAGPIIVDGAKRDRAVWPGDMGIAVPTTFVSINDLMPIRNALSTMFAHINPKTGALPESGPPLSQLDSDTYHAWTLIGTYNYYLFSGDTEWLQDVWSNYTFAVSFLESKVDNTGLMNVTGLRDWARLGGGGYNAEGNAILYHVLTTATSLASYLNATALASNYSQNATSLKDRFNEAFWVEDAGMYRDNQTTTLMPQDANALAVTFNLTNSTENAKRVSEGLTKNWNNLGPVCPELPDTISPFISGFELQAHFETGNDARALDLLHREWGYMLATNLSVQSTLLEGFTANGSLLYRSYRGYNYDAAYTSHAHGWSAGPTSALSFYVVGMSVTAPEGQTWSLQPHAVKELGEVMGGYETGLGRFDVHWTWEEDQGTLMIEVETPAGTAGVFVVPAVFEDQDVSVTVDDEPVDIAKGQVEVAGGTRKIVVST